MMQQSPLGAALLKIGLRIGVDTGTVLNKYIKKRSDKNESLKNSGEGSGRGDGAPRSDEEKQSEKSKKSKLSGKSDQSNLSKKRNAKQAAKQSSKVRHLEKKARTHEPQQEQQLGDPLQISMTNKSMAEDAISSSFCLNSSYIPNKGAKNDNEVSELDGFRQTQASAYFGPGEDKSIA